MRRFAEDLRAAPGGATRAVRAYLPALAVPWGCAADPDRCPHAAGSDRGIFCEAHRSAVVRYVRDGSDAAERRRRLDRLREFFRKKIQGPGDAEQIHAAIDREKDSWPEFHKRYDQEHFWAGRDTNLPGDSLADLMKCGFRIALREMDAELGPTP